MKKYVRIFCFLIALGLLDWCVSTLLLRGLERYFGLNEPASILLIGHSHLMLALDKSELERHLHCQVAKYCREGVNVHDRQKMVEHYFGLPQCSQLKVVVYGVDPFMFTGQGLSQNSYKLFYPFMDNPVMDDYVASQASGSWDYWQHKLLRCSRYSDALVNSALRGWLGNWSNFKTGNVSSQTIQSARHRSIDLEPDLIESFQETIRQITSRNIRVILLNTPVVDAIQQAHPQECAQVDRILRQLERDNPLVSYCDYNPLYASRYDLFYDSIHLNQSGQRVVTQLFIRDFHKQLSLHP